MPHDIKGAFFYSVMLILTTDLFFCVGIIRLPNTKPEKRGESYTITS